MVQLTSFFRKQPVYGDFMLHRPSGRKKNGAAILGEEPSLPADKVVKFTLIRGTILNKNK